MKISRLRVQNFKSFDTVDVELGDLNVFIGANASGKSNFLSILTFLRDIAREGLEEAVSQAGPGLLQNVQLRDSEFTDFEVWIDWSETQSIRYLEDLEFRVDSTHYQLALREEGPDGFQIAEDEFTSHLELLNESEQHLGEVGNTLVVGRKNGRLSVKQGGDFLKLAGAATYDHSVIPEESPLLATAFFPVAFFSESKDLASLPIFDFDSSGLGTGSPISGPSKLTEDGSNVALVLRNLLQNSEQCRKFLNLARTLLPFVDDLDARSLTGESTLLFLQESYAEDTYLPASVRRPGQ